MDRFAIGLSMAILAVGMKQDPPAPPPVPPPAPPAVEITFPNLSPAPKPPKPPEPPAPGPVPIMADSFYVITSTNQFLAKAIPEGIVKINRTKGPITLFGRFADAPDEVQMREFKQPYVTIVTAGNLQGQCTLVVWPTRATTEEEILTRELDIRLLPIPPPEPPTPPKPPEPPTPPPSPAPIPEKGFRVLIVTESPEVSALPASQQLILTAGPVWEYLNTHAVQGPVNKEWRIWPKNVNTTGERKLWQDAMARPRTSYPWILISNGETGFEGPLPSTVAETLTLLKKYGGQ